MRKVRFKKGNFYHVLNRGTDKRPIFSNERDMWRFLQGLYLFNNVKKAHNILYKLESENGAINFNVIKEFVEKFDKDRESLVRILADCLMPNHFHLILEEINDGGISEFMQRLGTAYTKYFNVKYGRTGSLFEGTFRAVEVDSDEYLKYLLVYINTINPGQLVQPKLKEDGIRDMDKIISFAEEYNWSTNKEYLGTRESIVVDKGLLGEMFLEPEKYRSFTKDLLLGGKYNKASELFLE